MKQSIPSFTIWVLICVGALVGCSSMKIKTDYDPQANFMHLQSFGWMPRPPVLSGPQGTRPAVIDNGYINELIERTITRELVANKFKLGVFGKPDFLIAYHTGARRRTEARRWGYGHYRSGVEIHRYTEGTLVIDIIDPQSMRLIWRGSARNVISGKGRAEEAINKTVKAILSRFPPE